MKLSSTESVLKIVAIIVVAMWACAGATRLLYPGVWKWIMDKFSRCFFCICKPCRYLIGISKPNTTDQDFVGLKQHYILPVSVGHTDDTFKKSFSDTKAKPRKSEGSLKNPQRKREMTTLSAAAARGRRLSDEAQVAGAGSFIERSNSGPRRGGGGRGRKRGGRGRGRGRGRDGNFDYSDTTGPRISLFDGSNPLVDVGGEDEDENDDIEAGGGSFNEESQPSSATGSLLEM
jgi:hypothetical protein